MANLSRLYWLIAVCCLGTLTCQSARAVRSEPNSPKIDKILQSSLGRYHLASITVEVRKEDQIIYAKSLGYSDLQNELSVTPQGLYAVGSISKSLTSYCILNLVSQGKLKLSSKLGDILPDYNGPSRGVTILQMLTHTSGILDYAGDSAPALFDDPVKQFTKQEVVDLFMDKPLVFKPGTRWQYSNSAYYMLSLVIEKVTELPYEDVVQDLLLEPFGLSHIELGRRDPIIKNRVMGYTIDAKGQIKNASGWDANLPLGAGAYLASADDLTKYIAGLFSDEVPAAVRQMMFHKVSLADGTKVNYLPAALVESDFYGRKKLAHGGSIWGFLTFLAYYPQDKVATTVMVNTDSAVMADNAPIESLERKVSRIILGIPQPKIVNLPVSPVEAQKYVGTYLMPEFLSSGNMVRISFSENSLFMALGTRLTSDINFQTAQDVNQDQAKAAIALLYQGNGRFVEKNNDEAEVIFTASTQDHLDVQLGFWGWRFIGKFVEDTPPLSIDKVGSIKP